MDRRPNTTLSGMSASYALRYLLALFTVTMFLLPGFAYSLITPLARAPAGAWPSCSWW